MTSNIQPVMSITFRQLKIKPSGLGGKIAIVIKGEEQNELDVLRQNKYIFKSFFVFAVVSIASTDVSSTVMANL